MEKKQETHGSKESKESKERDLKVRQYFTTKRLAHVDYKDVAVLEYFTDAHARIKPKRKTHISAHNQRLIAQAIKRARFMALLPFVSR
jgi:small subunit ribosomal protein S18